MTTENLFLTGVEWLHETKPCAAPRLAAVHSRLQKSPRLRAANLISITRISFIYFSTDHYFGVASKVPQINVLITRESVTSVKCTYCNLGEKGHRRWVRPPPKLTSNRECWVLFVKVTCSDVIKTSMSHCIALCCVSLGKPLVVVSSCSWCFQSWTYLFTSSCRQCLFVSLK